MICPNEKTAMHPVKIESHYGQPILLEQCGGCGGIWFDESELFRARQGEAERIELLDAGKLRTPSEIKNPTLLCPRDGTKLFRFTDKHFPDTIILERCPSCHGIWLNRGDFTRYQEARQERMATREIIIGDDAVFQEGVERVLAAPGDRSADQVLGRLGGFLSTPLDERTLLPLESGKKPASAEYALSTTLNVLMFLLRTFVIR